MSRLAILIVDVSHTKPSLITFRPFKVAVAGQYKLLRRQKVENLLHKTPSHVGSAVHSILSHCFRHGMNIVPEVLHSEFIVQDLFLGQIVLTLDTRAVLCHVHLGLFISITQPLHQLPESDRLRLEPKALGLRSDGHAFLVVLQNLQVASEVIVIDRASLVLDIIATVMIHAVEVVGSLQDRFLLFGKCWETVAELIHH